MVFNSPIFFLFLTIVFGIFWRLENKYRSIVLLIASLFFYGFSEPILLGLLVVVVWASYEFSKKIYKANTSFTRKILLSISLIILFSPLIYFKYSNFITENLNELLTFNIPLQKILLPVGISFYTFQAVGYVLDVYQGKNKPTDSFFSCLLFISFFPQLVAGPIERASNLLPQLSNRHFEYKSENFSQGLKIMAWGLFKKVVIADRLAEFVDKVYGNPDFYTGPILLLATIFFSIQIYCDFSGYSDMAIGIARLFDIKLMRNFNRPYLSLSVIEFWRRWHISLSSWFKDYLYFPLGGNKVGFLRWTLNILIVFIASGFWHGAKWSFIIWGLIHGLAIIFARLSTPIFVFFDSLVLSKIRLTRMFKWVITTVFICLTWIFFRSRDLEQALSILESIWGDIFDYSSYQLAINSLANLQSTIYSIIIFAFALIIFMIIDSSQGEDLIPNILKVKNPAIHLLLEYILILVIVCFGNFGESPFIYFRF